MTEVIVVGAGPAGLVAALGLARAGVAVTVLESEPDIPVNLRGSTFHPSTLDMLDDAFGVVPELLARGCKAPVVQYRRHGSGRIAEFDFGDIADLTRHPYRIQAEQYKLCQALNRQLREHANALVRFSTRVESVDARDDGVSVRLSGDAAPLEAAFVVGADGANSAVRKSAGVSFEGFTWPERFLVASTPFDFTSVFPDFASVCYVADATEWYFLLRVPELWRVMFPVGSQESDAQALAPDSVQARLARVSPGGAPYAIAHTTLYKVHQRVASTYRKGRVVLSGDAAHVNNPLGGMGMNGGIHDSFSLVPRLLAVLRDGADISELDRYVEERRSVAMAYIQRVSIQNKRDLESADPVEQDAFEHRLREAERDRGQRRALLTRLSMLASLGS